LMGMHRLLWSCCVVGKHRTGIKFSPTQRVYHDEVCSSFHRCTSSGRKSLYAHTA
jgi:hypothetical protein